MKYKFIALLLIAFLVSCEDDDDISSGGVVLRDRAEVAVENQGQIEEYLKTHFYRLEDNEVNPNYKKIVFDTIAGVNSNETPVFDSGFLKSKEVVDGDVTYKLYFLQLRKGADSFQPTFADDVILTYRGETLQKEVFDQGINFVKFRLANIGDGNSIIKGFVEGIIEFKGATGFVSNPDGTVSFNDDFGYGAVFIPSGLAYFAAPPSGTQIEQYKPIIFTFQMYKGLQTDHDDDGIPSHIEDLNNNKLLIDDNTDTDGEPTTAKLPNFADSDDDGDGIPTKDEIEVNDANEDGVITLDEINFIDSNNDGTPDYLDPTI
ncbi:FKBP-type peptidyl-prolyl cis-trans isomerase [Mesonia sp. K7]|uniref:FKBP-type peptidyl-prolyl cis-trans isomerase n=1 Tax=Mesonia sp. K7 TaxID=2218606 RepID=UPI001F452F56|nr:hypothetical protein [Mesonia sp. K7]